MDSKISEAGDSGVPYLKEHTKTENAKRLHEFVKTTIREISIIAHGDSSLPKIGYDQAEGVLITHQNKEYAIAPKTLRLACKSALSRDEFTNEPLIKPEDIPEDIHPLSMNPVGNYALGINWSDGHSSLYPYDYILELTH